MADYALAPFDFGTDTESWERSAYDWLSLGASALGAVGLAAALVFPPTTAVVAAIVVTGAVAGAAVATINIAERISNNAFEWDRELAVDLLSIATAFAAVSGVALRGATAGISRAIAAGEPVTFTMVNRLRQVVGLQRAVLYLDLGNAIGSGFLLAQEAYLELREVDASLGPEALPEFRRLYGADEGQRRWRAERLTRILGILARAAVSGAITVVSIRSGRAALADAGRRYAAWHIPGAERPLSTRITVQAGPPLPAFPAVAGTEMAAFRRAQVDGVIARLGLAGDPAALAITERLSPQVAWSINTAFDALSESQRLLVANVMRPGGADLQSLRRFLIDGGNLTELAAFLESQPLLVRSAIDSFEAAGNRAADFRALASVPEPATFHWERANLDTHFDKHVMGGGGYPEEAWKWAQRLGIAAEYGFDRTRYLGLLTSSTPADIALRAELLDRFATRYGDYVHTVMARSNVFARSNRGADLVGSDGELFWAARVNGTISSGYFPDDPTTITVILTEKGPVRDRHELQNTLINSLRPALTSARLDRPLPPDQSVIQIFRRQ